MFLKDPFITIILSTPSALPDKLRPEDGGNKIPKTVELPTIPHVTTRKTNIIRASRTPDLHKAISYLDSEEMFCILCSI